MINKEIEVKNDIELQEQLKNAIESGDSEEFVKAQIEMAKSIEARVLADAKAARLAQEDFEDEKVMASRGLHVLTKAEKEYYNEVIGGESFAGTHKLMPPTIFDRVFEELRKSRPLLSEINFTNTTGTTEWVYRNNEVAAAWWGDLCAEIEKKLTMAFRKESTGLYKLSAYIPVCKSMLDLGPAWLDRFVREMLYESMAIAIELSIVTGTGKSEPIGMDRDLAGAVVDGVYPQKALVTLNSLSPEDLAANVMAPLTKGGIKAISNVLLVVNPLDYWSKIFPQTTYLNASGTYVYGVLPIPAKVVQSVAVTQGTMLAGMAKDYFLGVGSGQKIEYSDHYRFLPDERVYIVKQYANGKPLDNSSFIRFDISGLDYVRPIVETTPYVETRLASLKVANGGVAISPAFSANVHYYTATAKADEEYVTPVAKDSGATITAKLNGSAANLANKLEWDTGENVVEITVTNEGFTRVYILVVTKVAEA